MHKQNIIHRDLKPENILLESNDPENFDIKISDFGFSCFFDPDEGLETILGSPLYMAPEVVKRKFFDKKENLKRTYNEKVDIWSIGVMTFMFLSGAIPFPGKTKVEIEESILLKTVFFDQKLFGDVS